MRQFRWLFTVILLCCGTTAMAGPKRAILAATGGVVLGKVKLGDAKDRDVVHLPPCKTPANIKVVKLKVAANDFQAEVNTLKLEYYNGEKQQLSVRETFRPGTDSRWIDLARGARCIKKIVVIGDTNTLGWRPGKQATLVFKGK